MKTLKLKRYGVIDIGTLKVKLQIVEKELSGNLKTIYQSNNLTCLGCNMLQNGNKPLEKNLQKMLAELRRCKKLLDRYGVAKSRVVSTHALREMGKAGKDIAKMIKKKVGLKVEIIGQQEEAELFFNAVLGDFDDGKEYVVMDVGGGSVQILIGKKGKLKQSLLIKTGTSTLWDEFTSNHGAMDFPNKEEIEAMRKHVVKQLEPMSSGLKAPIIYGSSCIIDVFEGIRLPMQPCKLSKTHPYKVKVTDMKKFLENVWSIPYDVREEKYISPTTKYMWGIDKAFLNVTELAKKVKAPYIIPSNGNINQGLLKSIY